MFGMFIFFCFFFQAEDGIRDLVRSRGLGDVYKRQRESLAVLSSMASFASLVTSFALSAALPARSRVTTCLLYTSDAADDLLCVDLGGRRIIKKKTNLIQNSNTTSIHNI